MSVRLVAVSVLAVVLTGCASVSMESKEASEAAKKFPPPAAGQAGIYVYRAGSFGGALKKDIWINGECVGESAPNVFFYKQVKAGTEVKISTESEFSPNDLVLTVKEGMNHFVRQFIKMGLFVGGAGLELVSQDQGQKDVAQLEMAKAGSCSAKR